MKSMTIQQAEHSSNASEMEPAPAAAGRTMLLPVLLGVVGVLLLTVIFFGWIRYGVDLFLTFAATGLSYCF